MKDKSMKGRTTKISIYRTAKHEGSNYCRNTLSTKKKMCSVFWLDGKWKLDCGQEQILNMNRKHCMLENVDGCKNSANAWLEQISFPYWLAYSVVSNKLSWTSSCKFRMRTPNGDYIYSETVASIIWWKKDIVLKGNHFYMHASCIWQALSGAQMSRRNFDPHNNGPSWSWSEYVIWKNDS